MDLPFGCSGFVHGISVVAALLQNGNLKRALMINAETNSKNRNKNDRSVRPLFGDAATVTALEYSPTAKPINFVFGVDGSGYQAIWTKYGGMRFPTTPESLQEEELEPGVIRKGTDMIVNGMDVFAFAISRPPKSIKELIETFSIDMDTIDYLVLHQANKFIDEKIRKALKVDSSKVPYSLDEYGNVTSASIPLTLVARCQKELTTRTNHCIASGFGIGLAWASMELYIEHAVCSDIVVY